MAALGRIACISHPSIVALNRRPYDLLVARHAVDLTVIVPRRWRGDLPDPDLRYSPTPGGVPVRALPAALTGNGSLFVLRGLARTLKDLAPDLILLDQEPWSLVAAQTLRGAGKARLVFYTNQNLLKRLPPPFSWIRGAVYRRSAAAWAHGETTAEVLRRTAFPGAIHVLPYGVETAEFVPGPDPARRRELGLEGVVIGYVGRFVPAKGVPDLVAAAARLASGLPAASFTLCLVGAGPAQQEIAAAAADPALAGRVRILGPVPHTQAASLYRMLDVLVLPSRTTPEWREQFGRVLIEAAACGLPVVGSDSGEIPYIVKALGGTVYPEGDVTRLAEALRSLVTDAALRRRVGEAGRAVVQQRFTQEAVVDRMYALLEQAAA